MTEKTPIDSEWFLDTLTDAANTLERAITMIRENPRRAEGVMEHEITELYVKLNYAVNTARLGPGAINEVDHDALISWPEEISFEGTAEEDFEDEEECEEDSEDGECDKEGPVAHS